MMSYVLYTVTGCVKRDDGTRTQVTVSGAMTDASDKLACVFRRHPELLSCNVIEQETYNILGGSYHGAYQKA